MKKKLHIFLFVLLSSSLFAQENKHHHHGKSLDFVENKGQWNPKVLAHVDVDGGRMFIEKDALSYFFYDTKALAARHNGEAYGQAIKTHSCQAKFLNTSNLTQIKPKNPKEYYYNFFLGNDQSKWAGGVKAFQESRLENLYDGIDLKLYSFENALKYDLIIQAKANPNQIEIEYKGADEIYISPLGHLTIKTSVNTFIEQKPYAYQIIDRKKIEVPCEYELNENILSFNLPIGYDSKYELIIDPVLIFSTYSGSAADNWGFTAAYDQAGNGYNAGNVFNPAYPSSSTRVTWGHDNTFNGWEDIFIGKYSSNGRNLIYYTYLGGSTQINPGDIPPPTTTNLGLDNPMSILIDHNDHLVVLGKTVSRDFPTTVSAYDRNHNGGHFDITVSKFSSDGRQLLNSTFIGGNNDDAHNDGYLLNPYNNQANSLNYNYGDYARSDIINDSSNNYYIASNTKSTNFPSVNAYQRNLADQQDAVVLKINSNLSNLVWSTYFGGNKDEAAYGILLDDQKGVYVTGGSRSLGLFQNVPNPHQRNVAGTASGNINGFIAHFDSTGGNLVHGTYVGTTSYDQTYFIKSDLSGNLYVMGQTEGAFPVNPPGIHSDNNGKQFICKYSPDLSSRLLSTNFGSGRFRGPDICPTAFLVDVCERVFVSGWGGGPNLNNNNVGTTSSLTTTPNAFRRVTDGEDFYVIVFNRDLKDIRYATFMGGSRSGEHVDGGTSRFDPAGIVYQAVCAGCGGNSDFPTTTGAFSRLNNSSNCNMLLFKFDLQTQNARADYDISPDVEGCLPFTVDFDNLSFGGTDFLWDFDDAGAISTDEFPTYTFTKPGTYQVKLKVINCLSQDSIIKTIQVYDKPNASIDTVASICPGQEIKLKANGGRFYDWSPKNAILNGANTDTPTVAPFVKTTYQVIVSNLSQPGCDDTVDVTVPVHTYIGAFGLKDTSICKGGQAMLNLGVDSSRITNWQWRTGTGINNPNDLNPIVNPSETTTYYIDAFTVDNCNIVDSITVTVFIIPADAGLDKWICPGDSITLTATGGFRYLWNTGDTTQSIRVSTLDSSDFSVIAYKGDCESLPDSVKVRVNFINPSFTVEPDTGYAPQWVQFNNMTTGANQFFWDFGNGKTGTGRNPKSLYQRIGQYPVFLIARNSETGCADSLLFEFVIIDSVYLQTPNAFTINEDGKNDFYFMPNENFESINIQIFNRWGAVIFESTDPKFQWDGKHEGEYVQSGTYIYQINALGKNNKTYTKKGFIAVIR